MAMEDALYPLLSYYMAAPQWMKSSIGRVYSMFSSSVRKGNNYQLFLDDAALSDANAIRLLGARKLTETLQNALVFVPAYQPYRHLLKKLNNPFDVLQCLPLLTKEDIKKNISNFCSTDIASKFRLKTYSGGSTATPTMFYLHKGISRTREYAFIENFHQRAKLHESDVVLALRGRNVPSAEWESGPYWMYEPIKRQLILSGNHLSDRYMPHYMDAMRAYKPEIIQAYPSVIYPLARWLKDHPAPDVTQRIRGVMLFSENVMAHHMTLLKGVFGCPILKHYGQSERVLMAASMPDDERYFFWPQYGHFELVDEAGKAITKPGVLGEIVGTGYDNHVMPFIRYRTGDMAMLSDTPHPLLPGFPVVERIEGRRQEFLVCRDHRLIAVCSMGAAHSTDLLALDSIQYEQDTPGQFRLKVVASQPLSLDTKNKITRALEKQTQGGCTAEIVEVADIPRTTRGKHKLLIQHLDISRYMGVP